MPKANSAGAYDIPKLKTWIYSVFVTAVNDKLNFLAAKRNSWTSDTECKEYMEICSECDSLEKTRAKILGVYEQINDLEWVSECVDHDIVLTPISPRKYIKEVILDKNTKNIFMSATILDYEFFVKEHDLDPAKTCFVSCESTFPVENRPILYIPVGKLEYNNIEKSMKPFAEAVKAILKEHKNEKGVIFASSYAQTRELIEQVGDKRLITHTNAKDKPEMMEKHEKSKNTVIVSPTIHEGVDLVGDLSRFQIVLKIPFPSLGSLSIKRRAELYPDWYSYCTALLLIQCTGRSVRSDTDWATSYILDSNFGWWYKRNKKMFPKYWSDALHLS
jgi:Rad3-related DNA helicase